MSWDVIIPFLRPIEHQLRDPDVSDILVNGGGRVFIEKHGEMQEVAGHHPHREVLAGSRAQYRPRLG
jgi:Flp pilus assembly CpaF family ATPase